MNEWETCPYLKILIIFETLRSIPAFCFTDHSSLFPTSSLLASPCSFLILPSQNHRAEETWTSHKKPHLRPRQQVQLSVRDDGATPAFALHQGKTVLILESSSFAPATVSPLQPTPPLVPPFVCLQGELRTYSDIPDDTHMSIKSMS